MNKFWQNKIVTFLLMFFIFGILISFVFTGFDNSFLNSSGRKSVAKIAGEEVLLRDYQNRLDFLRQQYSRIYGGKGLSSKQVESLGLKEQAIQGLINSKLNTVLANKLGFTVGEEELKDSIKKESYFLTNEVFDVQKYRDLLRANNYTPKSYEKIKTSELKQKKLESVFSNIVTPKDHDIDIKKYRQTFREVKIASINRDTLKNQITISPKELKEFIDSESGKKRINEIYGRRKEQYTQQQEVKGAHILIKGKDSLKKAKSIRKNLTAKNFASIADKETEDPSGKGKGGDLGWFSKGKMVKEFESTAFSMKIGEISNPIKTQFGHHIIHVTGRREEKVTPIELVRNELATELIRGDKTSELKSISDAFKKDTINALTSGKNIESVKKKYKFDYKENAKIDRFDGRFESYTFTNDEVEKIFNQPSGQVLEFAKGKEVLLVSLGEKILPKKEELKKSSGKEPASNGQRTQSLRRELTEHLKQELNPQINRQML